MVTYPQLSYIWFLFEEDIKMRNDVGPASSYSFETSFASGVASTTAGRTLEGHDGYLDYDHDRF